MIEVRNITKSYVPKNKPEIVNVPKANYIAVRGKGDPNTPDGEYQQAIGGCMQLHTH